MGPGLRCEACHSNPPPWQRAHALVAYEGLGKAMVMRLKSGSRGGMAQICADLLVARFSRAMGTLHAVVPVPQHWRRTLHRGGNPVGLMGKRLAEQLAVPYAAAALKRNRHTKALKALGRDARAAIVEGSMKAQAQHLPPGAKRILLVDDVMSSGVTLRTAALALTDCNPQLEITVICAARQLKESDRPNWRERGETRGFEL